MDVAVGDRVVAKKIFHGREKNTKNPLLVISYLLGAHEAIYFLVIFGTVELLMWTSFTSFLFNEWSTIFA